MSLRWFLLVAVVLFGCSDNGSSVSDSGPVSCVDPSHGCYAPFVCRADPVSKEMVCLSPEGDVPGCSGTPSGQAVPFQPGPNGRPAHWALKPGCVATSFTSALSSRETTITAAVKGWDAISCSELCLDPPIKAEGSPDLVRGERRLHFRLGQPLTSSPAVATVNFEPETGRIQTVVITIDDKKLGQLSDTDFLRLVGFGIGLATAMPGTDSVMELGSSATAPTADDQTALCKLYGQPSYCGD